jgi:transposase InsO family protein
VRIPRWALLSSAGVTPIRLPSSSPNLNAYVERFVRSIKSECLNKFVLLGESHLRTVIREYLLHSHEERNHQGLAGQLISPPANPTGPDRSSVGSTSAGYCAFITQCDLKRPDRVFGTLRRLGA